MEKDTTIIDEKVKSMTLEEVKKTFTKDNPHPTGAYWNAIEEKWRGYRPTKGINPPWLPYAQRHRERRVTINEKKFLMVLSQTGNMQEAYKAVYKYVPHPDKRIEAAKIGSKALQIMKRIKNKEPELVAAFTFEDINKDFIKRELLNLYNHDHATIGEKTRLLELMGKTQQLFKDVTIQETRIKEIVDPIYQENEDDMPEHIDDRIGRLEIEKV